MRPLLPPGARAIALPLQADDRPRVGEVVVVRRPVGEPGELIKRILGVTEAGDYLLCADNPALGAESVDFGPVAPASIVARVGWRYWPLPPLPLSRRAR